MPDDPHVYKELTFAKAAVDFKPSDTLSKARRPFLVFLFIVALWDFAGVTLGSVSLVVADARIARPWALDLTLWAVFLYTAAVYFSALRNDIGQFRWENFKPSTFFMQVAQYEFNKAISARIGPGRYNAHACALAAYDAEQTVLKCDRIQGVDDELLRAIPGYDPDSHTYTYVHTEEDWDQYEQALGVIRPAFAYRYLAFVLPLHIAAGIVGIKVGTLATAIWGSFLGV